MEIPELRRRLDDFVADKNVVQLDDEAWWEQFMSTLVDPALDTRVDRQLNTQNDVAVVNMLAGATFGPDASLTLPSGITLDSTEANQRVRDAQRARKGRERRDYTDD